MKMIRSALLLGLSLSSVRAASDGQPGESAHSSAGFQPGAYRATPGATAGRPSLEQQLSFAESENADSADDNRVRASTSLTPEGVEQLPELPKAKIAPAQNIMPQHDCLQFSATKKNTKSTKHRHFLFPKGSGGKVYYSEEIPQWFTLPTDPEKIKLCKGNRVEIDASGWSKEEGRKLYRLGFKTRDEARACCTQLQQRCPKASRRRRLTASELLARRRRRPTSAEVVLGRLLEEIRSLQ